MAEGSDGGLRPGDVLAIHDLLSDHWERVDWVVEEFLADLFTDDAEMHIGTLIRKGRGEIHAYALERRAGEIASGRRTRHAMSNLRVAFDDEDLAQARFLLVVFAGRGAIPFPSAPPSNIADFRATCRRVGGRWLIASLHGRAVFAGAEAPANAR